MKKLIVLLIGIFIFSLCVGCNTQGNNPPKDSSLAKNTEAYVRDFLKTKGVNNITFTDFDYLEHEEKQWESAYYHTVRAKKYFLQDDVKLILKGPLKETIPESIYLHKANKSYCLKREYNEKRIGEINDLKELAASDFKKNTVKYVTRYIELVDPEAITYDDFDFLTLDEETMQHLDVQYDIYQLEGGATLYLSGYDGNKPLGLYIRDDDVTIYFKGMPEW